MTAKPPAAASPRHGKGQDGRQTAQDGSGEAYALHVDSAHDEHCPDCGRALRGLWTFDGLHFDGVCPKCGTEWAIRLATGR